MTDIEAARASTRAAGNHRCSGDGSNPNGRDPHPLRAALESLGGSLSRWTVMKEESDPFRMDTPANHRDAEWLAGRITALRVPLPIHVRGLHYALLGQTRPDGSEYVNTDKTWEWLDRVASVARTLNYVDYESISDRRSGEPVLT